MKKVKEFIRENKYSLPASFFIPAIIMIIIYATFGVSWKGEKTVLASDAYHQYVNAHVLYRNLMHNGKGFLYTFTSGLGLNIKAFASYYMGSFFMPLTYFFSVKNMPDAMYLFTILKFGCMGLAGFVSFKNMYKSLSQWLILAMSISYALMSFPTAQSELITWLDAFILFPLILWGLHSLMDNGKKTLYFVTLSILFIQNYYFGYMLAIFLLLYFIARTTFDTDKNKILRNTRDFIVTSALAGLTSMFTIIPAYLDLKTNGEELTKVSKLFTEKSWFFDLFSKNFVGSFDTTKYGSVPIIYVGIFPLILAILFFFTKSVGLWTKISYGAVAVFIIASFYFQKLDLFWQGMHAPNMFLHRYSFVFSLLIIILALETLKRIKEIDTRWIIDSGIIVFLGYMFVISSGRYPYVKTINVLLSIFFLLAYIIFLLARKKKLVPNSYLLLIASLFVVAEIGINAYYQINGLKNEWVYASRENYDNATKKLLPIADKVRSDEFYRMDNLEPDTANDGMKFDYNALAQFSSVRNRKSSSTLSKLGFRSDGTNLNLRYPNNTLIGDGLFAIKYNITNNAQPAKFGFNNTDLENLKENTIVTSPAIIVKEGYNDITFDDNNLTENQTNFLNKLSGEKLEYFTQIYKNNETISGNVSSDDKRVTLRKQEGKEELSFTYGITAPAKSQLYIRVPNISIDGDVSKDVTISCNDKSYTFNANDTGSYFNLGYYETPTDVEFKLKAVNNDNISFDKTQLLALNVENYKKAIDKINENPTQVKTEKNGAKITYDSKVAGDVFVTVPYDKGWSAKLDGKKVDIKQAQTGFMKIKTEAGKHTITMKFAPRGYKLGWLCLISGIALFIVYNGRSFLVKKDGENSQKNSTPVSKRKVPIKKETDSKSITKEKDNKKGSWFI
ncbi:YfhO family protein [Floricoccus penangensis]|uniref:YfhO family protein n=1 Tax=Floricoccus penangensis TaxID=1859475 RepID=UPI00203FAB42|nr:YfhO family protein [Floricoccus penangensis]URZ87669.1 YfhO family protein [Floricoccus penangensis]